MWRAMDKNFRSKEAQWTHRMNNVKKITLKHYNQMFITTNKEKILKAARGKKTFNKKEQTWKWQTSHQTQCKPRDRRITSLK